MSLVKYIRSVNFKIIQMYLHCTIAKKSSNKYACVVGKNCFDTVFNYIEKITSLTGGFYSDDVGYVGASCKKCPDGSFVQFDKAPGTSKEDCKSCPEGNNQKVFAKSKCLILMTRNTLLLPKRSKLSIKLNINIHYWPQNIPRCFTKISQKWHFFSFSTGFPVR